MDNRIVLTFDKTLSRLAGNPFGAEIYNSQVKDKIDLSKKWLIVFPMQIEDIAISFIQGFTNEIVEVVGKERFFDFISIECNDTVEKKFRKAVMF